jgi:hypothetical protein
MLIVKHNFHFTRPFGLYPRAHLIKFLPKNLKNLTCPSLSSVVFSLAHHLSRSLSETVSPFLPLGLSHSQTLSQFLSPSHRFSLSDSLSIPFSLSQNLPLSQTQSLSIPSLSQLRSPEGSLFQRKEVAGNGHSNSTGVFWCVILSFFLCVCFAIFKCLCTNGGRKLWSLGIFYKNGFRGRL